MTAQVLLVAILLLADVVLWIAGAFAPLSTAGRFRAFAAAAILLAVLCGGVIGWHRAAVVAGLAAWLASIVLSNLPGTAAAEV